MPQQNAETAVSSAYLLKIIISEYRAIAHKPPHLFHDVGEHRVFDDANCRDALLVTGAIEQQHITRSNCADLSTADVGLSERVSV